LFSKLASMSEGGRKPTADDIGATVSVRDYDGVGTLLFFGMHVEKGKLRCGIAMKDAVGKNNGTVGGHQYFDCEDKHGVLCEVKKVLVIEGGVSGNVDVAPLVAEPKAKAEAEPEPVPEPEAAAAAADGAADGDGDGDGELAATRLTESASHDPGDAAATSDDGGDGGEAEVDARKTCRHDECLRTNINSDALCGGHSCKVPTCSESKAASATLCPTHDGELPIPLPKGWSVVSIETVPLYMNAKAEHAQWRHPGNKEENVAPSTKVKKMPSAKKTKSAPRAIMWPQPSDLPEGWYQLVRLTSVSGFTDARVPPCEFVFYSTADRSFQNGDPRAGSGTAQNGNNVLPDGWTEDTDIDGDSYWVDWNSDMLTYDDPRAIIKPKKSDVLTATVGASKMKEHDQPAAKPRTLKRRSSIRAALQLPTDSDYSTWKIGAKETMAFSLLSMNVVDRADLPGEVVHKRMNRHLDILPNPRTRVILPVPAGKGSDPRMSYINANYIRGSSGTNKKNFIAAMGPLKDTVVPFWKMIWVDAVHEVVMVTGLVEKGQSKCARYWPAEEGASLQIGEIKVTNVEVEEFNGYNRTRLKVSLGKEVRDVTHWWFTAWPDHGVPKKDGKLYTDDVLHLIVDVKEHVASRMDVQKAAKKGKGKGAAATGVVVVPPPILLHCSAGVGRTGTFIAITHGMEKLETTSSCSPLRMIREIRQDRCALVQHPKQFDFVHAALVRWAEMQKVTCTVAQPRLTKKTKTMSHDEAVAARAAEKAAAAEKLVKAKSKSIKKSKTGKSKKKKLERRMSEVKAAVVEVNGEAFEFAGDDEDGTGTMTKDAAAAAGMPEDVFNTVDVESKGEVTLKDFETFTRRQSYAQLQEEFGKEKAEDFDDWELEL